ncbi:MAG: MopE-related protein [bacterium]
MDEETAGGACDGGAGRCAVGRSVCDDGVAGCAATAAPAPERCDGFDDDCDGIADEGQPDTGLACNVGVGVCEAGATVCLDGAIACRPGAPGAEQCNRVDDDCDGRRMRHGRGGVRDGAAGGGGRV